MTEVIDTKGRDFGEILETLATHVGSSSSEKLFYFLPYWFEHIGDGRYIAHGLERTPQEVKDVINAEKNEIKFQK